MMMGGLLLAGGLTLLFSVGSTQAQDRSPAAVPSGSTSTVYANSWALVIGINAYQKVGPRLNYAVSDAKSVADLLPELGFPRGNIRLLLDAEATRARIEHVLYREFAKIGPDDRLLVYFAGHGETLPIRGGEEGYFLPVDADRDALPATAILMEDMRRIGKRVRAKHVLFIMDACFSGFSMTRDLLPRATDDTYLASVLKEPVVQVLTAGRKGERAVEQGGHGLFTRRLIERLRGLNDAESFGVLTAAQLAAWIEQVVARDSGGRMNPQFSKLDGEGQFLFLRGSAGSISRGSERALSPASGPRRVGSLAFTTALDGVEILLGDQRLGEARAGRLLVVENVAVGGHRVLARKSGYRPWERDVQVIHNERAEITIDLERLGPTSVTTGEDGADMVLVPAGEFLMGSVAREAEQFVEACKGAGGNAAACKAWADREVPRHRVVLDAYYVDRHEVTNALFDRFVRTAEHRTTAEREGTGWVYTLKAGAWDWPKVKGADWRHPNGPGSKAEAHDPVVQVSWHDANAYCRWAGKRLPTEAEWEKAARGTDERRYPWGEAWDSSKANGDMAVRAFMPVGSYPDSASPYGALDMAGNVAEWVADWFAPGYYQHSPAKSPQGPRSGDRRVLRGGSWDDFPAYLRTTFRNESPPDYRVNVVGFRCARDAR